MVRTRVHPAAVVTGPRVNNFLPPSKCARACNTISICCHKVAICWEKCITYLRECTNPALRVLAEAEKQDGLPSIL